MNRVQVRQQGFTMIELVMVIVILGVLSAFALPKFADLGESARIAALEGVAGSMRSAVGITRAQLFATGGTNSTTSVELDGSTVALTNGYPGIASATAPGILAAAGLPLGDLSADPDTFNSGDYTYAVAGNVLSIHPTGLAACVITYTAATATVAPIVNIDALTTTNC